MTVTGRLARPLLAGIFVYGGIDALRDPESKAKAADDVALFIADIFQLPPTDTATMVRFNGAIQVAAGTLLALGKWRRLSALVLAASLVPTTYAGHRFWEEVDDEQKARHRIHFLKNAAMFGGLLLAAGDTGGRPSLTWRAKQAGKKAAAGGLTGATAAAKQLNDTATRVDPDDLKKELRRMGRRAAKAAEKARKSDLALRAAEAARLARREGSEFAERAAAAASRAASATVAATSDTVDKAREALADLPLDRAREVLSGLPLPSIRAAA